MNNLPKISADELIEQVYEAFLTLNKPLENDEMVNAFMNICEYVQDKKKNSTKENG